MLQDIKAAELSLKHIETTSQRKKPNVQIKQMPKTNKHRVNHQQRRCNVISQVRALVYPSGILLPHAQEQ